MFDPWFGRQILCYNIWLPCLLLIRWAKKSTPWDFPTFISKQISNKRWPTQRVHCAGFKLNSFCFFWCAHVSSKQQSIMKQLEFNFKAMCQAWCQVVLRQQIHQGILKNWIHALGKFSSQSYGVSGCMYVLYRRTKFESFFFLSCQLVFNIQIWIYF